MSDAAQEWIARRLAIVSVRRPVIGLLAGSVSRLVVLDDAPARRKHRKRKKKVRVCLDGQSLTVPRKKRGSYLAQGATPGTCMDPPCHGTCDGKPCGADDGCGNDCGCPAGQACWNSTCLDCTLSCNDAPAACGAALQTALDSFSFNVVCPGRYLGNFRINQLDQTLVGAGRGADPATSTILDGNRSGRVLLVEKDRTVTLEGLRLTGGGPVPAAGIRNEGRLSITRCAITGNTTTSGTGGILHFPSATGPLEITNSTITENSADFTCGGIAQANTLWPVTLTNCVVAGNRAGVNGSGTGGGIQVSGGQMTVTGGRVTDNAADDGGGIFAAAPGVVTLNGVTVSGNMPNQCVNVSGC